MMQHGKLGEQNNEWYMSFEIIVETNVAPEHGKKEQLYEYILYSQL